MKISPGLEIAWHLAARETVAGRWPEIEPEHFLAALTKLPVLGRGEVAAALRARGVNVSALQPELALVAEVLEAAGIAPDDFRRQLRARLGRGTHSPGRGATVHRSGRSRKLFERAAAAGRAMKSERVHCGHLFLSILEERDTTGCQMLREQGADLKALARKTWERLTKEPARSPASVAPAPGPKDAKPGTPLLERHGRDLMVAAWEGELGLILGRRQEIERVLQALGRRRKSKLAPGARRRRPRRRPFGQRRRRTLRQQPWSAASAAVPLPKPTARSAPGLAGCSFARGARRRSRNWPIELGARGRPENAPSSPWPG